MSTDLPARLRDEEQDLRVWPELAELLHEAADEIERLGKRERALMALDMARDASAARKRNRKR